MMATQLNYMYHEEKLPEGTVVRVDKYITSVVSKTDDGRRVLIILEMSIIASGKLRKIGKPVNYCDALSRFSKNTVAVPKIPAQSNVPAQSEIPAQSKIAALSSGVLLRIMSGKMIECPVFQILGATRIISDDTERVRLIVSDGKYFNSYAMMVTQLNFMYHKGKLNEGTIVRVDKYITSLLKLNDPGKRVLIILEMTILGTSKKIGQPVNYQKALSPSFKQPQPVQPNIPTLSTGVLPHIMNGIHKERKPVLQIFDAKIIMIDMTERIRLWVSDGKYFNDYVILAKELNSMYHEGKLKDGTVVRVNKYTSDAVNKHYPKIRELTILDMTILTSEAKEKIGKPISYREGLCFRHYIPVLSTGVLSLMMSGKEVDAPVLQILNVKTTMASNETEEQIHLMLSDGKYFIRNVMLGPELEHLYHEGKLKEKTIVMVNKYSTTSNDSDARIELTILKMSILRSGEKMLQKIGKPVNILDMLFPSTDVIEKIDIPALSSGALPFIMNGVNVDTPILQILHADTKPFSTTMSKTDRVRLEVSDGKYIIISMLAVELESMFHEKKLTENTIVKLNKYKIIPLSNYRRYCLEILEMTILSPGEQVKERIGDPIVYQGNNPQHVISKPRILPALTEGVLPFIVNGARVKDPVLQLLFADSLSLSDGKYYYRFSMSNVDLDSMFLEKNLKKHDIVKLDEYTIIRLGDGKRPSLWISKMTILTPGVGQVEQIGEPIQYEPLDPPSAILGRTDIPPLSTGILSIIMTGANVENPIFQILAAKVIGYSKKRPTMLLTISDGTYSNSKALTTPTLYPMLSEGKLNEKSIVRVDKYALVTPSGGEKPVLLITKMTILISGEKVKLQIGEPIDYEESLPKDKTPPPGSTTAVVPRGLGNNHRHHPFTKHDTPNEIDFFGLVTRSIIKRPKLRLHRKNRVNLNVLRILSGEDIITLPSIGRISLSEHKWIFILILLLDLYQHHQAI
ncbi:uncharacterized protein isoform X2 [Musca autumnalis]